MRNKLITLFAAAALASGPVAAQAQSAAPLSVVTAARAGAQTDDANEIRGGIILPALAIIAVIAVLALTDTWPFDDGPSSP